MIVCDVIRRKSALIKRETGHSPCIFFYPANKRARQPGDKSRLYCLRISPFQAMPIFATKLLGYSTLVEFMVFDVGAARARTFAKKEKISAIRAIAWRDPARRKTILTILASRANR